MKFTPVFTQVLSLYSRIIETKDGKMLPNGRFTFNNLWILYDRIDRKLIKHNLEWHKVMAWSIYGVLHRMAIEAYVTNIYYISTDDIDSTLVEMYFYKNLQGEGYEEMLLEYERNT